MTALPLRELWDDAGPIAATTERNLSASDLRDFLASGRVRFVVADVGQKLYWVPESECYRFWKEQVAPHLADPGTKAALDAFPGCYCYFASERSTPDGSVVVLEKHH